MKKLIAMSLVVAMSTSIVGCSSGPSKGHYYTDANGVTQYEPSADAKNADTWATTGIIVGVIAGAAALATGIVALTK